MARILILGATSPIARALALRFGMEGDAVYLAARDLREAERLAADIAVRTGANVMAGAFDAADFPSHPGFMDQAITRLGGLDGVIVNFGTLGDEDGARIDPDKALAIVNQNFTGAVTLLTIAARHLEQQKSGFIIAIGSVAGERGRPKNYVYGSAKSALATFTQGLRGRLASAGIQVMTVKLGTVDTRMTWGRSSPLIVSPEAAADSIYQAWKRGAEVVYVPWFWWPIMTIIKAIPERIFKRLSV
jgi:decaprenylphospho-beta-D-erythro-pentofuranosid-2-ulose 2-reductase